MSFVTDKCYQAKSHEVKRNWYVVDAEDKILGRLASRLAIVLMGKHKPQYTPHIDTGDFVVVTNAEKIKLTGRKIEAMTYSRYSYHPGGLNVEPIKRVLQRHPERVIENAVRRMLPKNALARRLLLKLKVYAGPEHPHQAQQCQPLDAAK